MEQDVHFDALVLCNARNGTLVLAQVTLVLWFGVNESGGYGALS